MRTLLIDMPSGVAGDMLLAALIGCGANPDRLRADLARILPVEVKVKRINKGGLAAVRVEVEADQAATWNQPSPVAIDLRAAKPSDLPPPATASPSQAHPLAQAHPHRPWRAIRDLLAAADLPARVKDRAQRVFRLLAEAEGAVHGIAADDVEFHEVGAVDAIADVVGCCLALEQLGIGAVIAGPFTPGQGTVSCAHGRMPVPVPAVAEILKRTGAPCRILGFETGELTTPTGAALVAALATRFIDGESPPARFHVRASGYGAGQREIPRLVNVVRCLVLEDLEGAAPAKASATVAASSGAATVVAVRYDDDEAQADPVALAPHPVPAPVSSSVTPDLLTDRVVELRCQLDDATGEQLADLLDRVLAAGALDAWHTPVVMKKGRPGALFSLLATLPDRERLARLVLTHSPAIGLRWQELDRYVLPRRQETVLVAGQAIPLKIVRVPGGGERAKPEADAVAAAAHHLGWDFARVAAAALAAWRPAVPAPADRKA